jgi:hypothetical protein
MMYLSVTHHILSIFYRAGDKIVKQQFQWNYLWQGKTAVLVVTLITSQILHELLGIQLWLLL